MLSRIKNTIKIFFYVGIILVFWSSLLTGSPMYLVNFLEKINFNTNITDIQKQITEINRPIITYSDSNQSYATPPSERSIILRMDDVQGYLWRDLVINLTNAILENNMSVTYAVIPSRNIGTDMIMTKFLYNKSGDPRIEIAQHGYSHKENEYENLSENESYNITKLGLDLIIKNLKVVPVTFIPPYNEYNESATRAIARLGFKIISSERNDFQFKVNISNNNLAVIGFDTETKSSDNDSLMPVSQVVNECKKALDEKNTCVVMIHPQDYTSAGMHGEMDYSRYLQFLKLLEGLKGLNAKFITFHELIKN